MPVVESFFIIIIHFHLIPSKAIKPLRPKGVTESERNRENFIKKKEKLK